MLQLLRHAELLAVLPDLGKHPILVRLGDRQPGVGVGLPRVQVPSGERQSTRFSRPRATQAVPSGSTPKKSLGANTFAACCTCSPKVASPYSGAASKADRIDRAALQGKRSTGMLSGRSVRPGSPPPSTAW